jgi:hypothetical protein
MSKIEDLEARIEQLEAQLEAKAAPPAAPEVPKKPWQPYDPTEAMSPPVRLTGREQYRTDLTPEQALNDAQKERTRSTMMPLAQFLNKGQPLPEPPPAVGGGTIPRDGKVPGQDAIDRIARGFAEREKLEALANQADTLRKLKGL